MSKRKQYAAGQGGYRARRGRQKRDEWFEDRIRATLEEMSMGRSPAVIIAMLAAKMRRRADQ